MGVEQEYHEINLFPFQWWVFKMWDVNGDAVSQGEWEYHLYRIADVNKPAAKLRFFFTCYPRSCRLKLTQKLIERHAFLRRFAHPHRDGYSRFLRNWQDHPWNINV